MTKNTLPPGYKHEPAYGRINDGKIYVGIVKDNSDIQKMGRVSVYIPEIGGDPEDPTRWFLVRYASPFAGVTNIDANVTNSQNMKGTQNSYGMWMIPPDLNNQVLVVFLNGEPTKGVWFACLWQQNMNHMVPGLASDLSFQEGEQGVLPPVTEYNKKDTSLNPNDPRRPRFDPLHNALVAEGLYSDFERGPTDASARRESPSKVFGFISPRGNHWYFDDDETNEYFRIRMRGGAQILVHQTNGYIYLNTAKGNSWLEISDDGIDMYSKGNISMRTEQDFNVRADQNINLDAGLNINLHAGQDITQYAKRDLQIITENEVNTKTLTWNLHSKNLLIKTDEAVQVHATTDIKMTADANVSIKAATIKEEASGTHSTKGGSIKRDGAIADNGGGALSADAAADAEDAVVVPTISHGDRKAKEGGGSTKGKLDSIVSRLTHHEPWPLHPSSANLEPPRGDVPGQVADIKGTGDQLTDVQPGGGQGSQAQTKQQRTGEGDVKTVEYDKNKDATTTKVGAHNVAEYVIAAIRRACDITGVDFGFMMAMAEKESSFNPNAIPMDRKTGKVFSSAKGLYQIIDSTWNNLYKNYGEKYKVPNDRFDAEANALMAAFLTKENAAALRRFGVSNPTATHLYMAHFAGPSAAAKLILGNPSSTGVSVVGSKAADANPWIFYDKGSAKTVSQITNYFRNFMEPRAIAYANAGSNTTA